MSRHDQLFEEIKFHIESHNYPSALVRLRRELEAHPDDPQILFWLGLCLAEIGEFNEAEIHLKHAAVLDASNKEIAEILQSVRQRQAGEEIQPSLARTYFEIKEPVQYKKKECPNCHKRVAVDSWQCGYCHQLFWMRITVVLTTTFLVAGTLIGLAHSWFAGVIGTKFQSAQIVNKAGENGGSVRFHDVEWNMIGMGLMQHQGRGYTGLIRGAVENAGNRTIEKAVVTIFFQFESGKDVTFIWFDVYSWKPGVTMDFVFPGIYPPYRPSRCELRIESVQFAATEPAEELQPELYMPPSDHFRAYRFVIGEKTIGEHSYHYYKPPDPWTLKRFLSVWIDIIPAFIFNYFCVLLAVFLVNICEPGKAWNEEWRLDAIGAAFVVMGFIAINTVMSIANNVLGMLGAILSLFALAGFLAKLFLFYLFFKRSFGFTFIMIIFYVCLTIGGMGLWYNIFGIPEKSASPPPAPIEMMQPGEAPPPNPR